MSEGNELLEYALRYARRGWSVFPCGQKRKAPITKHGCKDATTDKDQIQSWWAEWPDANIGIATGQQSFVALDLDVDEHNDGEEVAQSLYGFEVEGPAVRTGSGGMQAYYEPPGFEVRNSAGQLGDGIDVRGDGGYVIVPPSVHPNGERYEWIEDPNGRLPRLPEWVAKPTAQPDDTDTEHNQTLTPSEILAGVPRGKRNDLIFKYACRLYEQGLEKQEVLILVQAAAEAAEGDYPEPGDEALSDTVDRVFSTYDGPQEGSTGLGLTCLADVEARAIQWLWPGRIPIGKLTLLAGDPGLGKSLLSLDIAARVSTGTPWPDNLDARPEKGDVFILTAEDDLSDTVVPRLEVAEADLSRIQAIDDVTEIQRDETTQSRGFSLETDTPLLDEILFKMAAPRLLIIDPISAYMGKVDSHTNADVRGVLKPLADLAQRHDIAVLAITHLRKSGGKAVYRAMGSLAFTAAARQVHAIAKDPEDDTERRRLMLPVKANLTADDTGMAYTVEPHTIHGLGELPRAHWEKNTIPKGDVDSVLGGVPGRPPTKRNAAEDWLCEKLKKGPVRSTEIIEDGLDKGFSEKTLRRAREAINGDSNREGGTWYWTL